MISEIAWLALGLAVAVLPSPTPSKPAAFLSACPASPPGGALCGKYEVYEDRASGKGRSIALKVMVLPAIGPDRAPDPLFYFHGGPGGAATDLAPMFAGSPLRQRRDIVLIDQRGTGGSHGLHCDLYGPPDQLQGLLGDMFPLAAVSACRAQLERDTDLRHYTTTEAMEDVDEVRRALGYGPINAMGASYGTRAALVFLRQHPDAVRTLLLVGVAPTNDPVPREFPRDAERSLEGVLGECAAEASCHAAFPDGRGDARRVFDRLARGPVRADVLDPETGRVATVSLSRDAAAEALRYLLYQAGSAGLVPAMLHEADAGKNMGPLAEMALAGRQMILGESTGLYLAVTCAEDVPFVDPADAQRAAAGTFLGDYRWRQQSAACQAWVRAEIPAGYREPVRSGVPALVISGEWDPVTPPTQGDEVSRSLSNSRHLVVPHGSHGNEGLVGAECVDRLEAEFVERASSLGLDTACLASVRRAPFALKLETSVLSLPEEALHAFAGRYTSETPKIELTVEVVGDRLKVQLGGEPLLFAPVSAARFRAVGPPGVVLSFERAEGKIVRAIVEEGGAPVMILQPGR
jgi:pimeloyl-ACP methyl ester carboxylesterase